MRHPYRRPLGLLLAVWLAGCLLLGPRAFSQEPAAQPAASATADPAETQPDAKAESLAPAVVPSPLPFEVLPQIFYVRDRDGKLQAVPGMSYEELMRLWKQQHQLAVAEEKPAYTLESLELSGIATGASAELVARFKIIVHDEGWVRIPLHLGEAVPREVGTYDGPGEHVLERAPDGEGLVAWIRGQTDETHELALKLVAKVEQVGPQSRMKLTVPPAAVSQMQLQVPLARAVARVSEGSTLDSVRPLAGGKTEIKVLGLSGDFELSWHPAETKVAGLPAILEASSEQLIRINGRSANTFAKLTVRSLGSEFDHFQVRLPPGADYIGTPENGVSLVAVDASAPGGKLYDVRLAEKTVGPVEVQLVTERVHDAAQDDSSLELAGFEVIGAVRQWGTIAVQVEGNWQVVWGESNHVRSVDDVAAQRGDELAAGFEYFVQPYSLTARVVPQRTRIRVEPQYTLLVGADDVRLEARLKYTIRGAKVRTLTLDAAGWEFDTIEPASLANVDTALAAADRQLTIPLLEATSGEVELKLTARRRLEATEQEIRLELPQPQGDTLPADLAVVSDDPVELLPQLEQCVGLTPQAARAELILPTRQQEPLFYRTSGDRSRFVAVRRVHAQAISTAMSTRLEVREDESRVDQIFVFQVAYQPAEHLTLVVPAGLSAQRVSIVHEGVRITPTPLRDGTAADGAATPIRVKLPAPVIGRCELRASYVRSHAKPPTQASALVTVPLVVPGEGQLSDNQMQVVAAEGLTASYPQGPWSREGRAGDPDAAGLLLAASRAISEITLAISSEQDQAESATTIERALLETDLTSNVRLDRATFRVATTRRRIEILLPEQADLNSLALSVNGVLVAPEAVRQRTIAVPLDSAAGEHFIEVRYRFAERAPLGSQTFASPEVPAARWVQQVYWQVNLPPSEHLLFGPSRYTSEQQWVWSGGLYARQTTLQPADLQRWISEGSSLAGSPALPLRTAAGGGNRYLFSTAGAITPLELVSISRSRLVLLASLPLVVLGLGLIYMRWMRHPAVLLVVAVVVAGIAFVEPHVSILLAQAAVVGVLLVGVAWLLARLSPRSESVSVAPSRGSSYAAVERSVTELYHRSPSKSHPPSTATNPLISTGQEANP